MNSFILPLQYYLIKSQYQIYISLQMERQHLQEAPKEYSFFYKYVGFYEQFKELLKFRTLLLHKNVQIVDLKDIEAQYQPSTLGQKFVNAINSQFKNQQQQFSLYVFVQIIFNLFKWQFISTYLLVLANVLSQVLYSIVFTILCNHITEQPIAFVIVGGVCLAWLFQFLFYFNAFREIESLSLKLKAALFYSVQEKILSLSQFGLTSEQIGMITNSVVEFHDILETSSINIFITLALPFGIIGFTVLLVLQIGWFGIVGVLLSIFCEWFHYFLADFNSKFLMDANEQKNRRIGIMNEILNGIMLIKMHLWENLFLQKVLRIRRKEMQSFVKYGAGLSLQIALSEGITEISTFIALYLAATYGEVELTQKTILLAIIYLGNMKLLIIFCSSGISCYYQISLLLRRFVQIFTLKRIKMKMIKEGEINSQNFKADQSFAVQLQNFSCYYTDAENQVTEPILKDITLKIEKGSLIGVIGEVGSGKTTFLLSLVAQMPYYSGKISVNGSVAYVEQEPAIFSGTIKENIIYGQTLNQSLYEKALDFSCLNEDLNRLENGDQTVILERAINLSGGQKTRIAIARAFYSNRDILVLDDPLSSLDAKVCQRIFANIMNLNKNEKRTIILATHQTKFLKGITQLSIVSKTIYKLEFGQINKNPKSQSLLKKTQNVPQKTNIPIQHNKFQSSEKSIDLSSSISEKNESLITQDQIGFFFEINMVKYLTKYIFFNPWNYVVFTLSLLSYFATGLLHFLFIFWMARYNDVLNGLSPTFFNLNEFWKALIILLAFNFFFQLVRTFMLNLSLQLANQSIHKKAIKKLFNLSLYYLDQQSIGQTIDKFSVDLGLLDSGLIWKLSLFFIQLTLLLIEMGMQFSINPIMTIFNVCSISFSLFWNYYSKPTIMTVKYIDLKYKNPVVSEISENLQGLAQIEIYHNQGLAKQRLQNKLTDSIRASRTFYRLMRVFSVYGVYFSLILLFIGYFLNVTFATADNFIVIAMSAVFLYGNNDTLSGAMQGSIQISTSFVSLKRIFNFLELETERQSIPFVHSLPIKDKGIVFENLSLRYGENKQLALQEISFSIRRGEKVALVGRTGSGKSSIVQSLYRLHELEKGSKYFIEGENALEMPLKELRSKFIAISQKPFIFQGTVKENLDPNGKHDDEKIKDALREVKMHDAISSMKDGINTVIDGSTALSVGQKQLLCLARVILESKPYLIMDEATANIDQETNEIIKAVVARKFKESTVIAIAHRLDTVQNFDRIIVLSKGKIIEEGSPSQLIKKKGEYYEMYMKEKKKI